MKKIAIITINDNNNYGNRLQNYAVQQILKDMGDYYIETIRNDITLNSRTSNSKYILKKIKRILKKIKNIKNNSLRLKKFKEFNQYINFSKKEFSVFKEYNDYDYLFVGSDQVWNPTFGRLSDFDLLNFKTKAKKIAYSASFGISKLPDKYMKKTKRCLKDFKNISVREDDGKEIINQLIENNNVEVLLDPTMMLDSIKWDRVCKKPKQLKEKKYVLNYFLGEINSERKRCIEEFAEKNNCEIINILDKDSKFYQTGPSEFLYLEKNAYAIFTDSFHSCVFAILYNVPFVVFEREDKNEKMNSRINTLLKKFDLEDRTFKGKINIEDLHYDSENVYKKLEDERLKTKQFLKIALDKGEYSEN